MSAVLYLVMRNDIPSMNPGKLAAQAAHCANAFEYEFNTRVFAKKTLGKLYKEWKKQTDQGFGTTIVLGADKDFIGDLDLNPFGRDKFIGARVYDPTYPCSIPVEVAEHMLYNVIDYVDPKKVDINISVGIDKGFYLRNELVGAFLFGDKEEPAIINRVKDLELYP